MIIPDHDLGASMLTEGFCDHVDVKAWNLKKKTS